MAKAAVQVSCGLRSGGEVDVPALCSCTDMDMEISHTHAFYPKEGPLSKLIHNQEVLFSAFFGSINVRLEGRESGGGTKKNKLEMGERANQKSMADSVGDFQQVPSLQI